MPIRIAEDAAHLALKYVAAVSGQGYLLSREEFEDFVQHPERRVTQRLQGMLAAGRLMQALAGEAESVLDWMSRLGWLWHDDVEDLVHITELGKAVLGHLESEQVEVGGPVEVLLDPQNPISYAEVIQRIAQRRDAMLVDPYFRLDQLLDIVNFTSITRILTSEKIGKASVAGLAKAMEGITVERPFEIRVGTKELHDRYLVPNNGDVDFVGTSLGGVGKGHSIMGTLGPETSQHIRKTCEELWKKAAPLAAQPTKINQKATG